MSAIPAAACWDRSELPLLLETMAAACGAASHGTRGIGSVPPPAGDETAEWIESACGRVNVEAQLRHTPLRHIDATLTEAAPAILALADGRFVGLLDVNGHRARVASSDSGRCDVPRAALRDVLCAAVERQFIGDVDALIEDCATRFPNPERVRRAIVREQAGACTVVVGWQLRLSPGSSFGLQVKQTGIVGRMCLFVAAYAIEYALTLAAWWLLGLAALSGRLEIGWLAAWVLMMGCALACRAWRAGSGEAMAVALGGLVKQRLMAGTVRLDPDVVRHHGVSGMLARVIEAEALESIARGGAFAAILAPAELVVAVALLWYGAGGALHAGLLVIWIAALAGMMWRNQRHRAAWLQARLTMTEDLVERMNGHRTRVAQEHPHRWHAGEDELLAGYLDRSARLDRSTVQLNALIPRLWLLAGVVALTPAFIRSSSPSSLALSIAALLLAHRSLRSIATGLPDLGTAALAWQTIAPLFRAAAHSPEPGVVMPPSRDRGDVILAAHDVTFRYHDRCEPLLQGCSVEIREGDRVLLEGGSGKGKSTLASLLTGLRMPNSGLLLAGGLDQRTLGDERWRRRIAYAPQSHENYVFSGSLAFNLLMGRAWPPRHEDLVDAHAVCADLGLDDLLARMPAGLDQIVGESGWQLSDGERSRVFLARTLLSGADLLVLDESFSGLDPETLQQAHSVLRRRARTVLMVAHR